MVFASYVIRARLAPEKVDPDYVATFLQTPESRALIRYFSRGEGKPNLSIGRISSLPVVLPPKKAQSHIVQLGQHARTSAESIRWLRGILEEALLMLTQKAIGGALLIYEAA
jgi:hypothetical protein